MYQTNPISLTGIRFIEFSSQSPAKLEALFYAFGFSKTHRHVSMAVDVYTQGNIVFLLNSTPGSHSAAFESAHGPCISAMGWSVAGRASARLDEAVARGAQAVRGDYEASGQPVPAMRGIGESLIYLVDPTMTLAALGFAPLEAPVLVKSKGFVAIDHLTNNVQRGTMARWAAFYKDIFGFSEVRYFDIRGAKTGLTSYALKSPCGTFCIPINEATEAKSQINEYLEEYNGPGIQHLAFLTTDILASLRAMDGQREVQFLDIDADYYATVFDRVKGVQEDHGEIQRRNVLVDGDDEGYLLQIFTKNVIGPIFIELIQRQNHLSFGEGNFGALFRSIERDQMKRGYLTE